MITSVNRATRSFLKFFFRAMSKRKAMSILTKLSTHPEERVRGIALSIRQALSGEVSSQERASILKIEDRRKSLLASEESVMVIDYGAGSPDSNRTQDEMKFGITMGSTVSRIASASKKEFWCLVLFKLVRAIQPRSCLELGTCVGISSSYIAAACKLNGGGKVRTLEGDPSCARIATETFNYLSLENASVEVGPFHKTLIAAMDSSMPIDLFFNDGHHDYNAVIENFNKAMPYLSKDALIVVDDIKWSKGMKKAWIEIRRDPRVAVSIDLGAVGLLLLRGSLDCSLEVNVPLQFEA